MPAAFVVTANTAGADQRELGALKLQPFVVAGWVGAPRISRSGGLLQAWDVDRFFPPRLFASAGSVPSPNDVSYLDSYGVLTKRQPTGGARTRQVEHVTQRERVWRSRQRRHGPHAKRKGGGARWTRSRSRVRRNCWHHSSLHRPPCFSSEDNQPLRPPSRQLRVACDLAPARRNMRDPRPGVGPGDGPVRVRGETSVASQHKASPLVVAPYTTKSRR